MLFGRVERSLGLDERRLRGVQIAPGDGSLSEELLAAGDDALVEVKISFGLGEIELGFLIFLWNLCFDGGLVGSVGRVESPLIVGDRSLEVTILEGGEKLAGSHMRSALHVEFFNRSRNFGRDGGLSDRRENGIGGDVLGDGLELRGCGLDSDRGGRGLFFFAASERQKDYEAKKGSELEWACFHSEGSGEGLQVGAGNVAAENAVGERGFGLGHGRLCVHNLKGGGFAS